MLNPSACAQRGSVCHGQSIMRLERRALILLFFSFSRHEGRAWMSQSCAARTPPIWRRCCSTRCCVCATRCCRSAARARSAPICSTLLQSQRDPGLVDVPLWHLTRQECPVAAYSAAQHTRSRGCTAPACRCWRAMERDMHALQEALFAQQCSTGKLLAPVACRHQTAGAAWRWWRLHCCWWAAQRTCSPVASPP